MSSNLLEIAEKAAEDTEYYNYPDFTEFQENFGPIIDVYLRFNWSTSKVYVNAVKLEEKNVIVVIGTYSTIRIPIDVLNAANPVQAYAELVAKQKLNEYRYRVHHLEEKICQLEEEQTQVTENVAKMNATLDQILNNGWDSVDKKYPLV